MNFPIELISGRIGCARPQPGLLIAQGAAQLICDHFLSLRVGVPVPLGDRYTPNDLVVEPIVQIYGGETSSQPEMLLPSVLHALPLGNTNPWQKVSTCADSAATQTNRALYHLAEAITPATGSCQGGCSKKDAIHLQSNA